MKNIRFKLKKYYKLVIFAIPVSATLLVLSAGSTNLPLPLPLPEYNVDPNGGLSISYPLSVPAGTGNMTPSLSLNYHSSGGSGVMGLGWSLASHSEIIRLASENSGAIFKFSHTHMGELIPLVDGKYGIKNNPHITWEAVGDSSNPESWIEYNSTDGSTKVYGDFSNSKILDPNSAEVWSWALTEEKDIHQNKIRFNYEKIGGNLLISSISYAKNQRVIEFEYLVTNNTIPNFSIRAPIINNRLLKTIRMESNSIQNHSYQFEFKNNSFGEPSILKSIEFKKGLLGLTHSKINLFTSEKSEDQWVFRNNSNNINEDGYGSGRSTVNKMFELLKSIVFNIVMGRFTGENDSKIGSSKELIREFTRATQSMVLMEASGHDTAKAYALAHLNKNKINTKALEKHVYANQGVYSSKIQDAHTPKEEKKDIYFDETEVIARIALSDKQRKTCHYGKIACICAGFVPGCAVEVVRYCGSYMFFGGHDACMNGITGPTSIILPTDINGDGIGEFSRILGRMDNDSFLKINHENSAGSTVTVPNIDIKYNSYLDTGDIDGDGRTDLVFQKNGRLYVAFSNGDSYTNPVEMSHIQIGSFPNTYRRHYEYSSKDFLIDWNQDGRADFVHVDPNEIHVYLSSGRSFGSRITYSVPANAKSLQLITKTQNRYSHDRISSFVDIDGDGELEHISIIPEFNQEASNEIQKLENDQAQEIEELDDRIDLARNQLVQVLNNPDTIFTYSDFMPVPRNRIKPEHRGQFDQLMRNQISLTEELLKMFTDSFDGHYGASQYGDILERHQNQLEAKISQYFDASQKIENYYLYITRINRHTGAVTQSRENLNEVGLAGRNWLLDVNGDGLPDLVSMTNSLSNDNPMKSNSWKSEDIFNESILKVRLNIGGKFSPTSIPSPIVNHYSENFSGYQFTDADGDGVLDFIVPSGAKGDVLKIYKGDGNGGFAESGDINLNLPHDIQSISFEDRNRDGVPDLVVRHGKSFRTRIYYSRGEIPEGSITKITDGSGGEIDISYKWKKDFPQAVVNSNRSYENGIPNFSPALLVEKITQKNSNTSPTVESRYNYANQRYKPGTRDTAANFGFETVTESQYVNGALKSTTTTHHSQNVNFAGMMDWQEVKDASGNLIQRTTQQYIRVNPTAHSRTVLPTQSLVLVYKNGALIDSKETITEYNPSFAYNPSKVTEIWNGRTTVKEITYTGQPSVNITALPSEEKVYINGELVAQKKNTFAEGKLSSTSSLVAPGKWYTEYYSYDAIGNIITQSNNLGRNLQYTYGGTTGSLPIEVKNPLGQTTTTAYDPLTDQEISTVDPNGIETTTNYDALGRPISVYLEGTKVQSISYEWTGTKYTTTTTLHSREGDSWSKTITDKDGNELKTESLVFNNITSTRETEYDALGRVHRTSHEYLTGESPTWTTTEYYAQAEDIEERPKRITSNTGEVSELSYTASTTHITVSKDGELLRTEILENDAFGQLKKKTVQDKAIEYTYNNKGQLVKVTDPGTGLTTMEYDLAGNKVKQTDQNSGTTSYTYNIAGELITQTDSRGITQTFNLDGLGRITKIQTNSSEPPTIFTYDSANSLNGSNTIGKLTKITDASGTTELAYDHRGNSIVEKRTIDDLTLLFQRTYDDLNRVKTLIYPEGTKLTNMYTPSGKLLTILMDSHDGSSRNHPVVTYTGPIQKEGKIYLQRKTGNKVEMDIEVDPLYRRPKSIQTKLSDGHVEQKVSYQYDKKGNITKVTDHFHEDRNQEFTYDAVNRITKANGKYGEETYTYHKNGNLLKRGQFNLQYNNPNHIHAVSRADSPQTGLINYQYDSIGNLIQRNGDQYSYNAMGKLKEITTEGGDIFTYTYDHSGNRIKKHLQNANTTTYSFGDLYEIHRAPGEPEKHTMYITGLQGDKVSQYSRPDAMLRTSPDVATAPFASQSGAGLPTAGFYIKGFWNTTKSVYLEIERDLAMVYHGLPSISLFKDSGVPKPIAKIFFWLFCFTLLLYYAIRLRSENPTLIRITSAIATYAFFFASGYGCTPLFYGGAQTEEGIPPWLLGLAIPSNTPSVSDAPGVYGGGGGAVGGGQSTARIPGMFFYHPDHLGSITMITDGHGQVLAGGERGGKSHISYRPYGEILRTDSYGPDISKYKYTGQEEDKESGLYYYKARYYDPVIGRFAQADSMAFPDRIQGMNRMMYVEGNPMRYGDESGNNAHIHMFNQIIKHAFIGAAKVATQAARSLGRGADYAGRKAGRGADGAVRQLISGGRHSRNRGNDLDSAFGGTNHIFRGIERSNFGNWLTKVYGEMRRKPVWRTREQKEKRNRSRLERDARVCNIVFQDNKDAETKCINLAVADYYIRDQKINTEPTYSDSSASGNPTATEWIIFACNFSNPGPHETSQFCQDDPKNPNNEEG